MRPILLPWTSVQVIENARMMSSGSLEISARTGWKAEDLTQTLLDHGLGQLAAFGLNSTPCLEGPDSRTSLASPKCEVIDSIYQYLRGQVILSKIRQICTVFNLGNRQAAEVDAELAQARLACQNRLRRLATKGELLIRVNLTSRVPTVMGYAITYEQREGLEEIASNLESGLFLVNVREGPSNPSDDLASACPEALRCKMRGIVFEIGRAGGHWNQEDQFYIDTGAQTQIMKDLMQDLDENPADVLTAKWWGLTGRTKPSYKDIRRAP
ncbi:unnamed protein product [Sympodiomycopsis kandeliae]